MQVRRDVGNREFGVSAEWKQAPDTLYLVAHVCFTCRKSFKFKPTVDRTRSCPDCGGDAYEMGRSFKAPAKSSVKQWKKVQLLFAHGFRFFSYQMYEYAQLPKRLNEVEEFIKSEPDHPFRVASPRHDLLPNDA